MRFYFNANNRSQVSALRRAGVKNIMLTHKYVGSNAKDFSKGFENVLLGPGFGGDKDEYHHFIGDWEHEALQFDDPNDPVSNYKNYKEGAEYNPRIIPILHQNYLQALALFKPNYEGDRYALGKMESRSKEDAELRKLPQNFSYHGLAKGRWVQRDKFGMIDSVDSTTWTSGMRGRKTDVWKGQALDFGEKGKTNQSIIQLACQKNLIHLSKLGLDPKGIINGEKGALTVAPLALYYMPMFKDLGIYEENFN